MFEPHNTGDNSLYTKGLAGNTHRKLCLDDLAVGFTKTEVANWARDEEFAIQKDILSVNKNNVFVNFAQLPFVWKPCYGNRVPADDHTLGIPENVVQFNKFQKIGCYDCTPLEFMKFSPIKTDREVTEHTDVSEFVLKDETDVDADPADTQDKFACALFGLPVGRLPHKTKASRVWKNIFATELVSDARQSLEIASTAILRVVPHIMENKFKMSHLKSWNEVKKWIFSYVKISDNKPDVLKFMSVLKIMSNPRCRCFTMQSRMISFRDYILPVLQNLDGSGEKIDLGEDPADFMRGKRQSERYSVFMNYWALQTCLSAEPFDFVRELKTEIARKRKIEVEDVDIYILLDEKRLLYDRINRNNDATLNLDMSMIDFSHDKSPEDVVKTVLEYQKMRAEAAGKAALTSTDKINFAAENVDANMVEPDLNEIFLVEENNCFYKRVNKPFGKNFRKFSFRNQYQSRKHQNRPVKNYNQNSMNISFKQ